MKLKLENRIDDDVMKHITGGTLEVSHETSADEMEHFAAARANCPSCGGMLFDYKFFVLIFFHKKIPFLLKQGAELKVYFKTADEILYRKPFRTFRSETLLPFSDT